MAMAVLAGCSGQGMATRAEVLPAGYSFAQIGGALNVIRPATPLTYSDGWPAKCAAMAYCAGQGRALNPAAFGRYQGGAWVFDGGCL